VSSTTRQLFFFSILQEEVEFVFADKKLDLFGKKTLGEERIFFQSGSHVTTRSDVDIVRQTAVRPTVRKKDARRPLAGRYF
jgi:hypothetical protein